MNRLTSQAIEELAREQIEWAETEYRHCENCFREMLVVPRGLELRLECASLATKSGLRYLLASGVHDSRLVSVPVRSRMVA